MVNVKSRSKHKLKPQIVVDYKREKIAVDIPNQINTYNNSVRKSMKWYRNLAFELLLNTSFLNAYILYKNFTKKNICITEFQKKLAVQLTYFRDDNIPPSSTANLLKKPRHNLQKIPRKASKVRRYCKVCFVENAAQLVREMPRKSS